MSSHPVDTKEYQTFKDIRILSTIGIILVVWGHSSPTLDNIEQLWPVYSHIGKIIYTFHMPLFVFISGYLFLHSNMNRTIHYYDFIKKKALRLLLPYFIISSITFPIKVFLSKYAAGPIHMTIQDYIHNLIYPKDNVVVFFWFLPMLFVIFLIVPFLLNLLKNGKMHQLIIITVILFIIHIYAYKFNIRIFAISSSAFYLLYFWYGAIAYKYKNLFILNSKIFISTVIFFSLLYILSLSYQSSLIIYELQRIAGIFMSLTLASLISRKPRWIFNHLDGYSYQIYLLHWFPQTAIKIALFKLAGVSFTVSYLLMLITGLYIPYSITIFIKKYVPQLLPVLGISTNKP